MKPETLVKRLADLLRRLRRKKVKIAIPMSASVSQES